MKILVISDAHGYIDRLVNVMNAEAGADIIVFAGDIAPYRYPDKTADYLAKAVDIAKLYRARMLIAIPGNMDYAEHYNRVEDPVYVNLHNSYKILGSYVFLGFGGSTITPFNTLFEFADDVIERSLLSLYNSAKQAGPEVQSYILITHVPPYGTKCDVAYNGVNIGSKGVRKFIDVAKPLLAICGHVHESRCVDRVGSTVIVNPGPLSKGFYAVIELGGGGPRAFLRSL